MAHTAVKRKVKDLPAPRRLKKDPGVPKFLPARLAKGATNTPLSPAKHNLDIGLTEDLELIGTDDTDGHIADEPSFIQEAVLGRVDDSARAYMREFRKVLELSDVVLQVLDARDPMGCRSKLVENEVRIRAAEGKRLVLVLNKIDLVPKRNVEVWLKYLRHDFPTVAFKSTTQEQRSHLQQGASGCLGADALVQLMKNYSRSQNLKTSVTVGVVGYPNVGKSSLINSLKRARVCSVAATPGHTRVAQHVILDKNVKLLDCPGIVFAGTNDSFLNENPETRSRMQTEVLLRNVVKVELVEDPITPVEAITARCEHEYLQKLYKIPVFRDTTEFLIMLALSRGRLAKGGRPDLDAAARSVLRDWNSGKISYHSEPPTVHPPSMASNDPHIVSHKSTSAADAGEATIVKDWGMAFDLAGLFAEADKQALEDATPMDYDMIVDKEHSPQPPFHSLTRHNNESLKRPRSPSGIITRDTPVLDDPEPPQERSRSSKRARLVSRGEVETTSSVEMDGVASSNPLNRSKLKKDAKRARKRDNKSAAFGLAEQLGSLGMA